jgi:hypothetical protein
MDEHEILEQTRKASIEAAANVLEFVARAKAQHQARARRRPRDKSGAAAPQGDLLMELALEHFYTQLVPSTFGPPVEPLLFTQAGQARAIQFENRSFNNPRAFLEITWQRLQGPRPSRPLPVTFVFRPGAQSEADTWRLDAPYGRPLELEIVLAWMPDVRSGRAYATELELTLYEHTENQAQRQTQHIPVTVERPAT